MPPDLPPAAAPHRLPDEAIERLLASGERKPELVALLGEDAYRELSELARRAQALRRAGPVVYVLPGLMGSRLRKARGEGTWRINGSTGLENWGHLEHNNIVGKKCANLGVMTKAGFHVPPGFALGVGAYERFMKETVASERLLAFLKTFKADAHKVEDTLKFEAAGTEMRKIVESSKMPPDMEETIRSYYAQLCKEPGKKDLFVATRSAGPASHPGQYETYLNVSGADEVVRNVTRVWSSTFNTRSIISRARLDLPLDAVKEILFAVPADWVAV